MTIHEQAGLTPCGEEWLGTRSAWQKFEKLEYIEQLEERMSNHECIAPDECECEEWKERIIKIKQSLDSKVL